MHAGYLGGVWAAVKDGLGAGMAALIVGLQPLLTAVWLSAFGSASHRVAPRQWLGLVLGLAAALWLSRFMESMLFGVTSRDPFTFAGATLVLCATAAIACYLPSRRVLRVDPVIALRAE